MKINRVMAISALITVSAVFGLLSCKKDVPLQPHISSVQLTVEDVSCTEAWLKVSLTDGIYKSVAVTNHLVIAVGWLGSRAVAVVGRRP